MYRNAQQRFATTLDEIREAGLFKTERVIVSPQGAHIGVIPPGEAAPREVLNFCANNYLGLANNPAIVEAAHEALEQHGYGMASVRFICGTQDLHQTLERRLADFLGTEDAILYGSAFDASGGLFETLLGEEDAIISDALNHASIIDGIRLCKARRLRWRNRDGEDLERQLAACADARIRLVVSDGVFSMDGYIAKLAQICDLADKYNALVHVDDSHATGFLGATGRGSIEHCGVTERVDIVTGTFGKALGGASGGFTAARKEIVELLRQRSRPYLFSNTLAPAIAASPRAALDLLAACTERRDRLEANTMRFRARMTEAGFAIRPGVHPIVPVMLGDARLASDLADRLLDRGIYVIGFSFPVVPRGQARIRVQLSAAHTDAQIDDCVDAFVAAGRELGIVA